MWRTGNDDVAVTRWTASGKYLALSRHLAERTRRRLAKVVRAMAL